MSTGAQIAANQAKRGAFHRSQNRGRGNSCHWKHFRYELTGSFSLLTWENQADYENVFSHLAAEHLPAGPTEIILG